MKQLLLSCIALILAFQLASQPLISDKKTIGSFPIFSHDQVNTLYVDAKDYAVALKATELLQQDIQMLSGKKPLISNVVPTSKNVIIIGTIGTSSFLDQLVSQKKLNVDSIKGKWEAYQIKMIKNPSDGIDNALVIAGSDRRGTAYGVFELSKQMGVSPWYWWADVPVQKKSALYYNAETKIDAPAVKYRGIFINDEAPALSEWSKEKFGGFNHKFYEKVFELILRMKGNYLWPAMWGSAFNDDDTLNPVMADQYAIIMGTSHHEPLARAHDEWRRYGKGEWNYASNATNLQAFWKKGVERMGSRENILSIGMRGDGDEPMTQGTATALLEKIVKDQREIIQQVTGKPASATPQLWALYKEVQDYYDKGMRVPDDVTLLLCDDNWGNIRKLPKPGDKPHPGGYGIYYHFDYVGGPRNYKWINTNQIERTWEQMHLAYEYGVDRIWIVNVGDIKPMELPIQFFLDYAWKPGSLTADKLPLYYEQFATQQFGNRHAKAIGEILARYTKLNSRRKPELLDANTYSIQNYDEAGKVNREYNDLLAQAEKINSDLPPEYRDAYFQLVLHPVKASANLYTLYTSVAYNKWYASKKWILANKFADIAKESFINDSLITKQYHTIANGKWNHMMDQTHIGYTNWQQPPLNKMPQVKYVAEDSASKQPSIISIEQVTAKDLVSGKANRNSFYERDGYVSMEAEHFTKASNTNGVQWQVIPNLGRTLSGITPFPVTEQAQTAGGNSPNLQYEVYLYDTGNVKIHTYLSPTLNYNNEGLRYAISMDDEAPVIINMHEGNIINIWNKWVADNIIIKVSNHQVKTAGKHMIKFWMVDPGVVLQKIVLDAGGLKQSYLGPEETRTMMK